MLGPMRPFWQWFSRNLCLLIVTVLCTQLRAQERPSISAPVAPTSQAASPKIPSSVRIISDVTYCTGGGHPLLMDLYLPNKFPHAVPAVLWLHGGGWRNGDKKNSWIVIKLAQRGLVAASANYRLIGEAGFPAAIEDAKCAVRFLRANADQYGIDPERIGIAGLSAGGHLAMLAGTAPASANLEGSGGWTNVSSRVSAVLSWYGPTDFSVGPTAFERGHGPSIKDFLGGTPEEKPENYKNASPVHWVKKGDPPLLMIHGQEDTTVPFDQSLRMEKAYRAAGNSVKLIPVKNAGHNFEPVPGKRISPSARKIKRLSVTFLLETLGCR